MYNPTFLYKTNAALELAEISIGKLIAETIETYVIDGADYMSRMDQGYIDMHIDPLPGIWGQYALRPLFLLNQSVPYAFDSRGKPIVTYADFLKSNGHLTLQGDRKIVIPNKTLYSEYPAYKPSVYYNMVTAVYQYFASMCKIRAPYIDVDLADLKTDLYIKPEFLKPSRFIEEREVPEHLKKIIGENVRELTPIRIPSIYEENTSPVIEALLDCIHQFVGHDKYNVYKIHVTGTSIHIQKGIDARIVEYHLALDAHMEEIRNEQPETLRSNRLRVHR